MATVSASSPAVQPARERRKAKARLEIARAAVELFRKHGYEATTVGDIAEAADYSVRSFYRYFTSKEDVVFFDIGNLLEDVHDTIGLLPAGTPLWRPIRENIVATFQRFQEAGQEFSGQVLRTWMTDPALAGPYFRFCDRWHQVIAQGWSGVHGIGDPDRDIQAQQIAHYVVSTCTACIRVYLHTGQNLATLLDEAFDRFEAGLAGFVGGPNGEVPGHEAPLGDTRASC